MSKPRLGGLATDIQQGANGADSERRSRKAYTTGGVNQAPILSSSFDTGHPHSYSELPPSLLV
jgi:hypothetical protein